MSLNKRLPLLPQTNINRDKKDEITYTNLLEQENQQLKLQNQKLLHQLNQVESSYLLPRRNLARELKQRDEMVTNIATTIISAFRQYQTRVTTNTPSDRISADDLEEIKIGLKQEDA